MGHVFSWAYANRLWEIEVDTAWLRLEQSEWKRSVNDSDAYTFKENVNTGGTGMSETKKSSALQSLEVLGARYFILIGKHHL